MSGPAQRVSRGARDCASVSVVWLCLAVWLLGTASAAAQQPATGRASRFEFGVSAVGFGPMRLGSTSADLIGPTGDALPVFRTTETLAPGGGAEIHLSVRLTAGLAAEATASWSRTAFRSSVSGDLEDVPATTLTERLSRLAVEGSATWIWRERGRLSLFLRAGGGWMEEVSAGAVAVAAGAVGNAGLGMKYWWRTGARQRHPLGLRVEVRALIRSKGIVFGSRTVSVAPVVSAGLVLGL